MKKLPLAALAAVLLFSSPFNSAAQEEDQDASWEEVTASPKEGWNEIPKKEEHSLARQIFLWIPNRIADLFDVFRVDVGVGPAAGAVVRVTEYGQAGYRQLLPVSVRAGLMGRRAPIMLEHGNEIGIGPIFAQSAQRKICPGELGAGVDILIVGGYAGLCFDELADFFGGLFLFDMKDDDWE